MSHRSSPSLPPAVAAPVAGLAGGFAWLVGMVAWFGPAQPVLTDPDRQSAKFLAALGGADPPPRAFEAPWILLTGCLAIGVVHALAYAAVRGAWRGGGLRRGLAFGLVAWALMAPWFEFYLPFNALREPASLVALELGLWLLVQLGVGVAIAVTYERLTAG